MSIEILDSNDNEPLFDFSQYTVTIPENTTVGTVVLTVRATDLDEVFISKFECGFKQGCELELVLFAELKLELETEKFLNLNLISQKVD